MPQPLPPTASPVDQQDYYLWLGSIGWYGQDKVADFKKRLKEFRDLNPETLPIGNEIMNLIWRIVGPATDPVSDDYVAENWSLANVVLYDIADMLSEILGGQLGKAVDTAISAYDVLPADHRIRALVKRIILTRWSGVQRLLKIVNSHWKRQTRKIGGIVPKPLISGLPAGQAAGRGAAAAAVRAGVTPAPVPAPPPAGMRVTLLPAAGGTAMVPVRK